MLEPMERDHNFISVVAYVRNNEASVDSFIAELVKTLSGRFAHSEIIFVDDFSQDRSIEILKQSVSRLSQPPIAISIIHLSYFQGLEAAMAAGLDMAIGDFVMEFDSVDIDFLMPETLKVYDAVLQGYDIVGLSSSESHCMSSKLFYRVFQNYSRNNIDLSTEYYRVLSRRAINRVKTIAHRIPYRKAIYYNCGLRTKTCRYQPVRQIVSHGSSHERFETAVNSLILFTDIGVRLATSMTIIMMCVSIAVSIYTIVTYLSLSNTARGWTTMMLFLSAISTGGFALGGLMLKYLSLILAVQHERQAYIYESVEKLECKGTSSNDT